MSVGLEDIHPHNSVASPPPPSSKNSHNQPSAILAETSSSSEVAHSRTLTTTQPFAISPRRSTSQGSSFSRHSNLSQDVVLNGIVAQTESPRRSAMFDKDLPPIPFDDPDVAARALPSPAAAPCENPGRQASPSSQENDRSPYPDTYPVPHHRYPAQRCPTAVALAQASLGLGFPHVMPHASSSKQCLEVNTIPFGTFIPLLPRPKASGSRRTRSLKSRRNSPHTATSDVSMLDAGPLLRRSSGLALGGAGSFPHLTTGPSDDGKEKDLRKNDGVDAPVKFLSRKPSFWGRRKQTCPEPFPSARIGSEVPLLPAIPHLAPIDLYTPPTSRASQHPGSLSRSHSDRQSLPQKRSPLQTGSDMVTTHTLPASTPPLKPGSSTRADSTARPRSRSVHSDRTQAVSPSPPPRLPTLRPTSTPTPLPVPPIPPPPPPPPLANSQQATSQELLARHSMSESRRQRSQTNPPLLRRFSINLFSPSSASPHSAARSSTTSSASRSDDIQTLSSTFPSMPLGKESPETYLQRVLATVSKADVAAVLASSRDPFHVRTLRLYLESFDFFGDPLDVALRKLLMNVGLPRETQQIDRVMEVFASRYLQCNPNLFSSDDHTYILAFSLIMLHTDAFNKSNRRKMTKADYVKNTSMPGIFPEILDCFYDNIVFAPFIFIEDSADLNGQGDSSIGVPSSPMSTPSEVPPSLGTTPTSVTPFKGKGNKVDPYYLITRNLLGPLRLDVEDFVPLEDPFSYVGTGGPWDEDELQLAFAKATVLEVALAKSGSSSAPFFGLGIAAAATALPSSPMAVSLDDIPSPPQFRTLKVAKFGTLSRKDDLVQGGRKATYRKWKLWGVILTSSQLLLFRDPLAVNAFLAQTESANVEISPPLMPFKPDELFSVHDTVAVCDKSYTKYENAFRFVMPNGHQVLFQATNEQDLHEWISRINYASAFRSAGVRMRPLCMSGKDVELTGLAAATSHLHDIQHPRPTSRRYLSWDGDAHLMGMLSDNFTPHSLAGMRRVTLMDNRSNVELDAAVASASEGDGQFKVTFDQVKTELAAGRWVSSEASSLMSEEPERPGTRDPAPADGEIYEPNESPQPSSSRSQALRSKIDDLDIRITAIRMQLDTDFRFVRNIAVLTPFQKSTRDRMRTAVQNVSKRITGLRLDLARLLCHRDVLSDDLAAEGRELHHMTTVALRAATESLKNRRPPNVPRMTLSFHSEKEGVYPRLSRSLEIDTSYKQDTYQSGMDTGSGWLTPISDTDSLNFLGPPHPELDDPPTNSSAASISIPDGVDHHGRRSPADLPSPSLDRKGPEGASQDNFSVSQEASDEQAAEWNETRAAKRVSLVRMPSDLKMLTAFGRHTRYGNEREAGYVSGVSLPGS